LDAKLFCFYSKLFNPLSDNNINDCDYNLHMNYMRGILAFAILLILLSVPIFAEEKTKTQDFNIQKWFDQLVEKFTNAFSIEKKEVEEKKTLYADGEKFEPAGEKGGEAGENALLPQYRGEQGIQDPKDTSSGDKQNYEENPDELATGWEATPSDVLGAMPKYQVKYGGTYSLPVSHVLPMEGMPPVRSQGSVPSCTAWATMYYTYSFLQWKEHGWNMNDTAHQCNPYTCYNYLMRGSGSGSSFGSYYSWLIEYGCANIRDFSAINSLYPLPDKTAQRNALKWRINYSNSAKYIGRNLEGIKQALAQDIPVLFAMDVYPQFDGAHGSPCYIRNFSGSSRGGHALTFVGYNDTNHSILFVNSWGTGWGDRGYCWMDYDLAMSYIWEAETMYDIPDEIADANYTAEFDISHRCARSDVYYTIMYALNPLNPMYGTGISYGKTGRWGCDTCNTYTSINETLDITGAIPLSKPGVATPIQLIVYTYPPPCITGSEKGNVTNYKIKNEKTGRMYYANDLPVEIDASESKYYYSTIYLTFGELNIDLFSQKKPVYATEQAKIFVNLTDTSGNSLGNSMANCRVQFNISNVWTPLSQMSYNSTSKYWEYNRSFNKEGTYAWRVECNSTNPNENIIAFALVSIRPFPYYDCANITKSGAYRVPANITSNSNICFRINASNVDLDCEKNSIVGMGSGTGILIDGINQKNVNISNCVIKNWSAGIQAVNSRDNIFTKLALINNTLALSMQNGLNSTFSNSKINGSAIGIILSNSSRNNITNISITRNLLGISVKDMSMNNIIGMNILNNSQNVQFEGSNFWNGSARCSGAGNVCLPQTSLCKLLCSGYYGITGNYWGNYYNTGYSDTCEDVAGDAVCDVPYTMDGSNVDYLPMTVTPPKVYLRSPYNGTTVTSYPNTFFAEADDWPVGTIKNATLYTNLSGNWQAFATINVTNHYFSCWFDPCVDLAPAYINVTLPNAWYIWNVRYCNDRSRCNFYFTNGTVRINVPASVALAYPANNSNISSTTAAFNCTASDNGGLISISLFVWNSTTDLYYSNTQSISGIFYRASWNVPVNTGIYNWTCRAQGVGLLTTVNRTLTVDNSAPIVTMVLPTDGYVTSSGSITFNCSAKDTINLKNITIFIWNSSNRLYYNNTKTISNPFNYSTWSLTGIPAGRYNWTCNASDWIGNKGSTYLRTFTIGTTEQYVQTNSPPDNYVSSSPSVTFQCTARDSAGLSNISLFIWNSTSYQYYNNSVSCSGQTATQSWALNGIPEKIYNWTCRASNTAGAQITTTNRTFTIDSSSPTSSLISPPNNTLSSSSNVQFNCSAEDNINLANITLYVYNGYTLYYNNTKTVSGKTTLQSWTLSGVPDGSYNWTCRAFDSVGISASADNWTLKIDSSVPTVSLNAPANSYMNYDGSISFNCSASDSSGLSNITLFIRNSTSLYYSNAKSVSGTSASSLWSLNSIPQGDYSWTCNATDSNGNRGSTVSRTFSVDLTGPTVVLNSPTQSQTVESPVDFNCSATDNYGLYNITLYNNATGIWGKIETKQVSGKSNSSKFTKDMFKGTYVWNCLACDGGRCSFANSNVTFTVFANSAPTVQSLSISPPSPITSDDLACTFNLTDEDISDSLSAKYTWFNGNTPQVTGTISVQNGIAKTITLLAGNTSKGEAWKCSITPNDGKADGYQKNSSSLTIGNTLAETVSVSLAPLNAKTADDLNCTFRITDADSADTLYGNFTFYKNGVKAASGSLITTNGGPSSFALGSYATSKGENWICGVAPYDGTGYGKEKNSSMITILNTAPLSSTPVLTPSSPVSSDNLTCKFTVTDADSSDSLSVNYTWLKGTTPMLSGTSSVQNGVEKAIVLSSANIAPNEQWRCSIIPYDGTEYGETKNSNTVTIQNYVPNVTSIDYFPKPPKTQDDITCTFTVKDRDASDSLTVNYAWARGGTNIITGTMSVVSDGQYSKILGAGNTTTYETWSCKITPYDGKAYGEEKSVSFMIASEPPTVSTPSISPSNPFTNDGLQCTFTVSDIDPEIELYGDYLWYKNGQSAVAGTEAVQNGIAKTITLQPSYTSRGEQWKCSITPRDNSSSGAQKNSSSVTIQNSIPVSTTPAISPSNPYTTNDLACTFTVSDEDSSDSLTVNYVWYKNGQSSFTGTKSVSNGVSNTIVLLAGNTSKGEAWKCSIIPNDGTGSGIQKNSTEVEIGNSIPQVNSISIAPDSPQTNDNLLCNFTITDGDNDLLVANYSWLKDNAKIIEGSIRVQNGLSSSILLLSGNTSKHENWKCSILPFDYQQYGEEKSSSAIIRDTPPTKPSSLSPSSGTFGGSNSTIQIECSGSTDEDGDTIAYNLYYALNGVYNPLELNGDGSYVWTITQAPTGTAILYCNATDGESDSIPISSTINIDNSGPEINAYLQPDPSPPGSNVSFFANITDGAGVAGVSAEYDNKTEILPFTPIYNPSSGLYEYSYLVAPRESGSYPIEITAVDSFGSTNKKTIHLIVPGGTEQKGTEQISIYVNGGCTKEQVSILTDPSSTVRVLYRSQFWEEIAYGRSTLTFTPMKQGTYEVSASEPNYVPSTMQFTVKDCSECSLDSQCADDEKCLEGMCSPISCALPVKNHECPQYGCLENRDCKDDEICSNYECEKLTGKCGYAKGHKWFDYGCCSDNDCTSTESCQSNECVSILGECGYVQNHQWIPYSCCLDSDCKTDEICIEHLCEKKMTKDELEMRIRNAQKVLEEEIINQNEKQSISTILQKSTEQIDEGNTAEAQKQLYDAQKKIETQLEKEKTWPRLLPAEEATFRLIVGACALLFAGLLALYFRRKHFEKRQEGYKKSLKEMIK